MTDVHKAWAAPPSPTEIGQQQLEALHRIELQLETLGKALVEVITLSVGQQAPSSPPSPSAKPKMKLRAKAPSGDAA